ncbi:DUF1573 domain-containing protein, partial [candidate division GN15 bacterium]|nr:DUF1573 domain-containing protein [candidate division GN15 bacterium]
VMAVMAVMAVLVLATAGPILAQPAVSIGDGTMNFGRVYQKQTVTHHFWVRATGSDTVHITEIYPGCGCTEIPLEDSTIAPGDSIPLGIIFRTQLFKSSVKKNPLIYTNVTDYPVELEIQAYVMVEGQGTGPLEVIPEFVDVSQFGEKTRRVGKFLVVNKTDQDYRLEVVDSSLKSFEVKLPDEIKAGETIEGKVRVFEDRVQTEFRESLTFRAVGIKDGVYSVPILRMYRPES